MTVDPAACHAVASEDAGQSTGDSGGADGGAPGAPEYGPTLSGSEGDDDDCKYHMKWASSGIYRNYDTTFTVTVTNKATKGPEKGAAPRLEIFLNDKHPAPNSNQKPTEMADGVYAVGPVQFDAPGKWTVRFHFHEECNDFPDSAHGHGAFYVDVP
ncbi:MAG: hypothetical protein NVS3B10_16550 [Polyangiales bacterium]